MMNDQERYIQLIEAAIEEPHIEFKAAMSWSNDEECKRLEILKDIGAMCTYGGGVLINSKFQRKLRMRSCEDMEAGISELAMGAWFKRLGNPIHFEPPTRNGRVCDFVAHSEPQTWWEIKSLQDSSDIAAEDASIDDLRSRLRRIEQAYIIGIEAERIERAAVPGAVNEMSFILIRASDAATPSSNN
jgi:hypothetical protein